MLKLIEILSTHNIYANVAIPDAAIILAVHCIKTKTTISKQLHWGSVQKVERERGSRFSMVTSHGLI
jgi:hypothetical protein